MRTIGRACIPRRRFDRESPDGLLGGGLRGLEIGDKGIGLVTAERSADSLFMMWSLLEQAYSLLYRNLDRHMAKAGVSQSQTSVLLGLRAIGHAVPLSSIGSLRALQAASVTALVDRLEERGLVRRVRTDRDRRVVNLELTSDGDALCDQLYPRELLALAEHFMVLEPVQFHAFMHSLRSLRDRAADVPRLDLPTFELTMFDSPAGLP